MEVVQDALQRAPGADAENGLEGIFQGRIGEPGAVEHQHGTALAQEFLRPVAYLVGLALARIAGEG